MRYIPAGPDGGFPVLELSRRNLEVLLAKLDDPHSARTLIGPENDIVVRAVENGYHYADRRPGPMLMDGEIV